MSDVLRYRGGISSDERETLQRVILTWDPEVQQFYASSPVPLVVAQQLALEIENEYASEGMGDVEVYLAIWQDHGPLHDYDAGVSFPPGV